MIVLERTPQLDVGSESKAELRLDPTDISFYDVTLDRVRIGVTVHNEGAHRSPATLIRIECAPLGAFVPWRPLAQMPLLPLEPGESRSLSTEVTRSLPAPLGDFNRVPPKRLLTAVSSFDQPSNRNPGFGALMGLLRRTQVGNRSGQKSAPKVSLDPDLWDWLGRGQPHWAGNINVFVGEHRVERHLARALRVYPGRTNLAMFIVGSPGVCDTFAFELVGLTPDWKAALYDVTNGKTLLADTADAPIVEDQWVQTNGSLMVILATQPPVGCSAGSLEVHVTRKGFQKTAVVEFNLDPEAQGTGCYFA